MGEARVKLAGKNKHLQAFEAQLLADVHALDRMLEEGWFEIDITRIGAEQEFCLVDKYKKPASLSPEVLKKLDNELFTTELAKFNMEVNVPPLEFTGTCLSDMENTLLELMQDARLAARSLDSDVIMTGILPTIRKFDMTMDNITPMERYYALCKAINQLRGESYELKINGIEELIIRHDSPLLEAANTGFQVHLQVDPAEFVKMYNIAQAITAPALSAATFSPVLFSKRLWKETRVALFQQSVDTRTFSDHLREFSPRVTFGNDWLRNSILEIYKEDIVRYRVLLRSEITENVQEKLESGTAPDLTALKVHNGTVYRWNRPCYGISNGKAHLRIENRVLPAGPTIVDEMANAALWLGLMVGMKDEVDDVSTRMDFISARSNFVAASRNGLDTSFTWFDGKKIPARTLLLEELLPIARAGLEKMKIKPADTSRYMDIIEERVSTGNTGSHWILDSYAKLKGSASDEEVYSAITASIIKNQEPNEPVHKWKPAQLNDMIDWKPSSLLVEECMARDLYTVHKDDIIQLVAEMMDWRKIRYVPVEDQKGNLIGLVTSRLLMKMYSGITHREKKLPATIKEIMITDPLTIGPDAKITEALEIMEKYQIGCLPVVKNDRLIGVITEQTFLQISARLIKRLTK